MCNTGEKSTGVQPSEFQPSKTLGSTCQMSTLPSSPPDATIVSECGDRSVSRTGAVWPHARGYVGEFVGYPRCSREGRRRWDDGERASA